MIKRPEFLAGSPLPVKSKKPALPLQKSPRYFIPGIRRPAQEPSAPSPRSVDFSKAEPAELQISDEALDKLFKVEIPDVLDTLWLAEEARIKAQLVLEGLTPLEIERRLDTQKPLGRPQRTVTEKRNIARSGLSVENKITELAEEVKEGRAESRRDQAILVANLGNTLAAVNAIQLMPPKTLAALGPTMGRLNIPLDHVKMGFKNRFMDYAEYSKDSKGVKTRGLVHVYLLNKAAADPAFNAMGGLSYNKPVKSFDTKTRDGYPGVLLATMDKSMRPPTRSRRRIKFLDLKRGGLVTAKFMKNRPVSDYSHFSAESLQAINPRLTPP